MATMRAEATTGRRRRLNRAFFEINSWVGMVLLGVVLVDLYLV